MGYANSREIRHTNSFRYAIFHNYVRPHEAMNGKTRAEAAGLEIQNK
jgi:hypothetical protein